MCFRDTVTSPNIWLTVQNGQYVPAPPMVYVPGQRQAQDRWFQKKYNRVHPTTHRDNSAELPVKLKTSDARPQIVLTSSPSAIELSSGFLAPQGPAKGASNLAKVNAQGHDLSSSLPLKISTKRISRPERKPEEVIKNPPAATIRDRAEKNASAEEGSFANQSIPGLTTLHDTISDQEPEAVTRRGSDNTCKDKTRNEPRRRPGPKPSVSFADRKATSTPASPAEATTQLWAAKAGAAIARQLVERENRPQRAGEERKFLRGSEEKVGPGKGRKSRTDDRREGRALKTGNWGHTLNDLAVGHTGLAGLGHNLPADAEDEGNIDDEIPGKWP